MPNRGDQSERLQSIIIGELHLDDVVRESLDTGRSFAKSELLQDRFEGSTLKPELSFESVHTMTASRVSRVAYLKAKDYAHPDAMTFRVNEAQWKLLQRRGLTKAETPVSTSMGVLGRGVTAMERESLERGCRLPFESEDQRLLNGSIDRLEWLLPLERWVNTRVDPIAFEKDSEQYRQRLEEALQRSRVPASRSVLQEELEALEQLVARVRTSDFQTRLRTFLLASIHRVAQEGERVNESQTMLDRRWWVRGRLHRVYAHLKSHSAQVQFPPCRAVEHGHQGGWLHSSQENVRLYHSRFMRLNEAQLEDLGVVLHYRPPASPPLERWAHVLKSLKHGVLWAIRSSLGLSLAIANVGVKFFFPKVHRLEQWMCVLHHVCSPKPASSEYATFVEHSQSGFAKDSSVFARALRSLAGWVWRKSTVPWHWARRYFLKTPYHKQSQETPLEDPQRLDEVRSYLATLRKHSCYDHSTRYAVGADVQSFHPEVPGLGPEVSDALVAIDTWAESVALVLSQHPRAAFLAIGLGLMGIGTLFVPHVLYLYFGPDLAKHFIEWNLSLVSISGTSHPTLWVFYCWVYATFALATLIAHGPTPEVQNRLCELSFLSVVGASGVMLNQSGMLWKIGPTPGGTSAWFFRGTHIAEVIANGVVPDRYLIAKKSFRVSEPPKGWWAYGVRWMSLLFFIVDTLLLRLAKIAKQVLKMLVEVPFLAAVTIVSLCGQALGQEARPLMSDILDAKHQLFRLGDRIVRPLRELERWLRWSCACCYLKASGAPEPYMPAREIFNRPHLEEEKQSEIKQETNFLPMVEKRVKDLDRWSFSKMGPEAAPSLSECSEKSLDCTRALQGRPLR